jgi:hypothetical protein
MVPPYDCVNHSTNSASVMAVNARMNHGKNSSMVFMIFIGRPLEKSKEDASGDV